MGGGGVYMYIVHKKIFSLVIVYRYFRKDKYCHENKLNKNICVIKNIIFIVSTLLFKSNDIFLFLFQKLKSLSLTYLEISPKPLQQFIKAMHHITTLNLSGVLCTDSYDGVLKVISENMSNLKTLNISLCSDQASGVQASAIERLLPTKRNPKRGCPELVHLNLARNSFVTVELLKKIILRLPKLRYLKHALLMKTLTTLTEKEMDVDTGRCLRCFYSDSSSDWSNINMYFDALLREPMLTRFVNITEVEVVVKEKSEHFWKEILMQLKKIQRLTLYSESQEFLLPVLKSNGGCLEYLHLYNLSGALDLSDIMRTCPGLVELRVSCAPDTQSHKPKIKTSKVDPVLTCLRKIELDSTDEYICSKGTLVSLLKSPCLEEICLSDVDAMSDDVMFNFLSVIRAGYVRSSKLKTIYLNNCQNFTEKPFVCWLDMEDCMLEFIAMSSCNKVNSNGLKVAAERYPKPLSVFVTERWFSRWS